MSPMRELRLDENGRSYFLGVAFDKSGAVELFGGGPRNMKVYCVAVPKARLCKSVEDAVAFFNLPAGEPGWWRTHKELGKIFIVRPPHAYLAEVYDEDTAFLMAAAPNMKRAGDELAAAAVGIHPTAPSYASMVLLRRAVCEWEAIARNTEAPSS